jgi:hypothetical protein
MLTFFFGSLCIDSSDNKNRAVIDLKYNYQFRHCIGKKCIFNTLRVLVNSPVFVILLVITLNTIRPCVFNMLFNLSVE